MKWSVVFPKLNLCDGLEFAISNFSRFFFNPMVVRLRLFREKKAAKRFSAREIKKGDVINLEMCRVKPADEKYKRGTGKWGLQFDEGSTVSVLKSGQVLAPDEAPVREFLKCTMDELVEVPDGTMIELTDCFIKVTPRLVKNRRSGHTLRGSITNGGIMMGMVSEIEKFVVAMLEKRKPIGVKGRFRGDEIIINYATENSYP
ncbi:hypothetical protein M3Y96_00119700 [Aphelenchoides besseyi]|nr:hypothetical protein M3Y96_00119700 [Aphelenchoides besseyi]